jgi:hypothetical protein
MKTRILFIAGLLALCLITPAMAAEDKTYEIGKIFENNGIRIEIEKIIVSDTPSGYSPINFPSSQYKFIKLYYTLSNPSEEFKKYQLKVYIEDDLGRKFYSDEQTTGENMPAGSRFNRLKEFAVYRNATYFTLNWKYFDMDAFTDRITPVFVIYPDATATPSPLPTATPIITTVPTSTPAPSPTKTPGFELITMAAAIALIALFGKLRR